MLQITDHLLLSYQAAGTGGLLQTPIMGVQVGKKNSILMLFVPSKQKCKKNFCELRRGGAKVVPAFDLQDNSPTGESVNSQYSSSSGESLNLHHPPHTVHRSVLKIPCHNRFQVLTNMESDNTPIHNGLEFESGSSSDLTKSGALPDDHLPMTDHSSMVDGW